MKPRKMTRISPSPLIKIKPKPTFFPSPNARWRVEGGVVGVAVGKGVRVGMGVNVGRGWVGVGVPGSGVSVGGRVGVGSEAVWMINA